MRVLGVDPGMADTGWALLEGERGGSPVLRASGLIRTPASAALTARLRTIHQDLLEVLRLGRPEVVAIEEMFFVKAASSVRATLQARGVILLAAELYGAPVREYNPRQVKSALTGSGSAEKAQMQRMVRTALRLDAVLRPDDVADAAAIALCHLRSARMQGMRVLDRIGGRK